MLRPGGGFSLGEVVCMVKTDSTSGRYIPVRSEWSLLWITLSKKYCTALVHQTIPPPPPFYDPKHSRCVHPHLCLPCAYILALDTIKKGPRSPVFISGIDKYKHDTKGNKLSIFQSEWGDLRKSHEKHLFLRQPAIANSSPSTLFWSALDWRCIMHVWIRVSRIYRVPATLSVPRAGPNVAEIDASLIVRSFSLRWFSFGDTAAQPLSPN